MSPTLRGYREVLGTPVHRFHMHWPWYVWLALWGTPLVVAGIALGTGSPGAAVVLLVILLPFVATPLTWFLRRHQLVLTERALVMGPFVPAVGPDVILHHDLDVEALRTWSNLRAYLRAAEVSSFSSGHMITEGSRTGVSLSARREGRIRNGTLEEVEMVRAFGGTVELFALAGSAEGFVRKLTEVLLAAGVPGAEQIPSRALPPGRLSGAKGSHRTEIPGYTGPPGGHSTGRSSRK